jgi:hypothetical protein
MRSDDQGTGGLEEVGEAIGRMAGRAAGQAAETAMNMAGNVLTSMFQAMGDAWWTGPEATQASRSFAEQEDRACREHFEAAVRNAESPAADYETARPLYHFGHVAGRNPAYSGKQFDEVEAELQSAWEKAGRGTSEDWSEMRHFVNYGYSRPGPDTHGVG